MPPIPKNKPLAVGASVFAGGFTLGVMKHFRVLCHLEESGYGAKTFSMNHPEVPVFVGQESWPLGEKPAPEGVDFLYGNPPCAAWSRAGKMVTSSLKQGAWKEDDRPGCTLRHFALLERLKPKIWVWESVVGAFTFGREFADGLAARALAAGYSVSFILHCASRLGMAQVRKRFFMVCHRIGFRPGPHSEPVGCVSEVLKSVADDPGTLTHEGEFKRFKSWTKNARPGEQLYKVFDRLYPDPPRNKLGQKSGRPAIGVRRLPSSGLALTYAGYMVVHPTKNRQLGAREQLALCGYPPDYKLEGRPGGWPALIARGVCPSVGEWLAAAAASAVKDNVPVTRPEVILYDFRKPGVDAVNITSQYKDEK